MTPETAAIFKQAIEETNNKYRQLEIDEARQEGLKEGRIEEKRNCKKNLKMFLPPKKSQKLLD